MRVAGEADAAPPRAKGEVVAGPDARAGVGVGAGLEDARRGIRWGGVLRGVLGAGVLGVVSSRYQAEH